MLNIACCCRSSPRAMMSLRRGDASDATVRRSIILYDLQNTCFFSTLLGRLGRIEWSVDMHGSRDLIPAVYSELRSQLLTAYANGSFAKVDQSVPMPLLLISD